MGDLLLLHFRVLLQEVAHELGEFRNVGNILGHDAVPELAEVDGLLYQRWRSSRTLNNSNLSSRRVLSRRFATANTLVGVVTR